ncbi:MAG: hypothetical protein WC803_13510 [Sphingomonas sp.]|jgi:hypothetical protein
MIRKDINLSDVIDYFKKNRIASFDEEIDQYGGYFITAGRIASLILAPTPLTAIANFCSGIDAASLRASKLLSWLPDKFKYKDRGREKFAIDRYELSSIVNYMLFHLSIKNSVKDNIMPVLTVILEHVQLEEEDRKELEKLSKDCDKESTNLKLPSHCYLLKEDISAHALKIIEPILSSLFKLADKCKEEKPDLKKIDISKVKEKYINSISLNYNAFIINFSSEFPEFALWSDTTQKAKIIKELKEVSKSLDASERKIHDNFIKHTEQLIKSIEELKKSTFINESGFPSFNNSYKKLFKLQTDKLLNSLSEKIRENITAHQNKIKSELNKPLIENEDIEGIIYPKNKEIYIAQSFQSIIYRRKEHKKGFLTANSLGENGEKGENIGNYLLQTLIDPNSANKPIILLGNPGAGKSMLSKMFAGLLCETNDFIPFLIKLRSVASNTANISEHINKGLSKSIENTSDINWLDWAKEFKERIPVIIMDGFDELMQSSNTELNNYLNTIKDFQDTALTHGICVRVILTSRITVMQDVYIPDGTKIIKLDSFDQKRRDLWVKIWNEKQTKENYKLVIPNNEKILHLAQEPLLMFMLAVYDFEKSELQHMTMEKNFNQSKLYDSLLNSFIERQLKKNPLYANANLQQQHKEDELFRLRLGMIALMMFLNDSTHKDTQKLSDELDAFGLLESKIQSNNVLGGFFFIHENKSTTEGEVEKLNYEFLHKTFGEFLAADFMLRVALKQCERSRDKIYQRYIFKFCFGYNWLHKHYNIQNFLFEHAPQIIKSNSKEFDLIIHDLIKPDIESLFENGNVDFPIKENQILPHKQVIEHLGMYSQNLIFLWLAISGENEKIKFEIFDASEKTGDGTSEPKYESQDRDETNKNKLLWKRLAKLWTLVGNYNATAKLNEWIEVIEKDDDILLCKCKSKVNHNFSDSAKVACNDFELILSFFDNEFKFSKENHIIINVDKILKNKPELTSLAIDSFLHRFHDIFSVEGLKVFEWFKGKALTRRQQISLMRKISVLKLQVEPIELNKILQFISKDMNFAYRDNQQAAIEYLKILIDLKTYYPLSIIFKPEILDEIFHRFSRDIGFIDRENPFATLEYIKLLNEINKFYPFKRRFKGDFLEESLHRLSKDMPHFISENPYSSFEYLKLINELRKYYPVGRRFFSEFYEESLRRLSHDIKYIASENPNAILEYMKLLADLSRFMPVSDKMIVEFFQESMNYLSEEWNHVLHDEGFNHIEYLKVIIEFKNVIPIAKMIPFQLVEESFMRISHDLIYMIRENPSEAFEYLNIIKELQSWFPEEEYLNHKKGNIFDETLHRLSKDLEMDFRENSLTILIYLELILINRNRYRSGEGNHILERLIESLYKRDFGSQIIQRALILLIQYKVEPILVERLLHRHSKIFSIYMSSPELARDIIEAMTELSAPKIFRNDYIQRKYKDNLDQQKELF